MSTALFSVIDSFRGLTVAVIGDAILDSYPSGIPERLCREAPVACVTVERRSDAAGGAANAAINAAALGARVLFLSVAGNDDDGNQLASILEREGIDPAWLVRTDERSTLSKNRLIASSQLIARFDKGSASPLSREPEARLVASLPDALKQADAVILSDYGCGLFTPSVVNAISRLRSPSGRTLVVDSRSPGRLRSVSPTAAKPNYEEAIGLLKAGRETGEARARQLSGRGEELLSLTGAGICAVTLDRDGALVFERGAPAYRTYARSARDLKATGAGDTFTAAFALALAASADAPGAAELASTAAGVVTSKDGTGSCSFDELKAAVSAGRKYIPDLPALSSLCATYRKQGKRIVFTNGCFDIIHKGHITHLNRSKQQGDILILGVNSDAGARRVKGPGRPINRLEDRIQVLAALSCVDHIAVFDEETAERLVRAVRPDVFTKGGDYTVATLPEAGTLASMGTSIVIFPPLEHYSTAEILRQASARGQMP